MQFHADAVTVAETRTQFHVPIALVILTLPSSMIFLEGHTLAFHKRRFESVAFYCTTKAVRYEVT
eukprot:254000-Amphidinium_carterae.1